VNIDRLASTFAGTIPIGGEIGQKYSAVAFRSRFVF
jgi:hypothetical protein